MKKAHALFDPYRSYHNYIGLNDVNNSYGTNEEIVIDSYLFDIISKSIDMTILSDGIFNLTMGGVIDVWKDKFESGLTINTLPDEVILNEALLSVVEPSLLKETIILDESKSSIKLNETSTRYKINLGAVSKGYALDMLNPLFNDNQPAIINAGTSSISFKGKYRLSNRDYYLVNLREPKINDTSISKIAEIKCNAYTNISCSGDYEKFFFSSENSHLYHHILDTSTGYSNSYHASVTLVSSCDSYILDCLSTILMNIEDINDIKTMINKFEKYANSDIDFLIIDRNQEKYDLYLNEGFSLIAKEWNDDLIEKKIIC